MGAVRDERIFLNEDTLWSGCPTDGNDPKGPEYLKEIRRSRPGTKRTTPPPTRPAASCKVPYTESYQPLGELHLTFGHSAAVQDYRRELGPGQRDLHNLLSRWIHAHHT